MDSDLQEVPMPNTAPPQVGQSGRAGEFVHVGDLKKLEGLEKALEGACATLTTFAENVMDFTFDAQHMLYGKVYVELWRLDRCEFCVDVK